MNKPYRLATFAAATLAMLAGTTATAHADPTPPDDGRFPVTLAFLHPLATNANLPNATSNFDLSLLYGRVGTIEGLQLGSVAMNASRGVEGAQISGVAAIAGGPVTGLQLSGAANVATDDVSGAQVGPINVAGPTDGLQLGVVNVGRKVRGLQLGIVNVADEVDGAAIGLVSISKDSVHPIVWTSNLQYTNAGVKFSTKYVFTILAAHFGTPETDFDNVGATFAIGGRVPLPEGFDLEIQGSFSQLSPWPKRNENKKNSFVSQQVVAGYSFAPHLRVFAGGGVRFPVSVEIGRDVSKPEVLAGISF